MCVCIILLGSLSFGVWLDGWFNGWFDGCNILCNILYDQMLSTGGKLHVPWTAVVRKSWKESCDVKLLVCKNKIKDQNELTLCRQ